MIMKELAFPDELLGSTWKKQKPLFAKLKGATGIGQALEDLWTEYIKVGWSRLSGDEIDDKTMKKLLEKPVTKESLATAHEDLWQQCTKSYYQEIDKCLKLFQTQRQDYIDAGKSNPLVKDAAKPVVALINAATEHKRELERVSAQQVRVRFMQKYITATIARRNEIEREMERNA